ncbi:hypothetical protein ACIQNG_35405 [Streptomyces sp. NPDC091377]|uniref:hypothetical protein n=1 Tax=Streptomyces sp. NPDC091377 TaxID=3365995 RepID=UPI00382E99D9
MRHNGRPPVKASEMRPENLSLRENEPRLVVCADCDTWRLLKRSMITPHRASDATPDRETRRYFGDKAAGGRRCPGSAQRIIIDITTEQWAEQLLTAESTAAGRRTTRPVRKPRPQVAPAPAQISPATRSLREQLTEHLQDDCSRCRSGHCGTAVELRGRIRAVSQITVPALYGQLRAALRQHRAACSPCEAGVAPCEAGRRLTARMAGLAQDQMRNTRPDLYRATRQVPTIHLTRTGFVVRSAASGSRRS